MSQIRISKCIPDLRESVGTNILTTFISTVSSIVSARSSMFNATRMLTLSLPEKHVLPDLVCFLLQSRGCFSNYEAHVVPERLCRVHTAIHGINLIDSKLMCCMNGAACCILKKVMCTWMMLHLFTLSRLCRCSCHWDLRSLLLFSSPKPLSLL